MVRWADVLDAGSPGGPAFRLVELVQLLALGTRGAAAPERVTTYTFAQFAEPLPTPVDPVNPPVNPLLKPPKPA